MTPKSKSPSLNKEEQDDQVVDSKKKSKPKSLIGIGVLSAIIVASCAYDYYLYQKMHEYQDDNKRIALQLQQIATNLNSNKHANSRASQDLLDIQNEVSQFKLEISQKVQKAPKDWVLSEINYLIKLAANKLYVEHNPEISIKLLEFADKKLRQLGDIKLTDMRKILKLDIQKLKSLPKNDKSGVIYKTMALQQVVADLNFAGTQKVKVSAQATEVVTNDVDDWLTNMQTSFKKMFSTVFLFKTREGRAYPLLEPEQQFYLKQNITSQLNLVIYGVQQENQKLYTKALTTSLNWSKKYFNVDSHEGRYIVKTLKELLSIKVRPTYPKALRSVRMINRIVQDPTFLQKQNKKKSHAPHPTREGI